MKNAQPFDFQPTLTRAESIICKIASQFPGNEVMAQNSIASNRPDEAETAVIRQAALDYIEGWFEGNAERMERALHPELAKRIVRTDSKTNRSCGHCDLCPYVPIPHVFV